MPKLAYDEQIAAARREAAANQAAILYRRFMRQNASRKPKPENRQGELEKDKCEEKNS